MHKEIANVFVWRVRSHTKTFQEVTFLNEFDTLLSGPKVLDHMIQTPQNF